jgi:hypothetical protein
MGFAAMQAKICSRAAAAIVAAAISTLLCGSRQTIAADVRVVATTDNTVPGIPGVNFSSFGYVNLNAAGRVAFTASYSGGTGVFSDGSGTLSSIARTGQPAPATAATFSSFTTYPFTGPLLTAGGEVAFIGNYSGGAGLYQSSGGTLNPIAVTGQAAPGGGTFTTLPYWAMNASGKVAFQSSTTIYTNASGTLTRLAGPGTAVPFNNFSGSTLSAASRPVINDNGRITFLGPNGIYVADGNPLGSPIDKVVLTTDSTMIGDGSTFDLPQWQTPLNNSDRAAIPMTDGSSRFGIWFKDRNDTNPRHVISSRVTEVPAITPVTRFGDVGMPSFNNSGAILMRCSWQDNWLVPSSPAHAGIYYHDGTPGGALLRLVTSGDPAPGTGGETFGYFNNGYVLSDTGEFAFGSATNTGRAGIWVGDLQSHLTAIALQGQSFDHDGLAATPDRIIDSMSFLLASSPAAGLGSPMMGKYLAYTLTFTPASGGGSGVYVLDMSTVPEPGSGIVVMMITVALAGRRGSRKQTCLKVARAPRPC